jgi:hypothetical protein
MRLCRPDGPRRRTSPSIGDSPGSSHHSTVEEAEVSKRRRRPMPALRHVPDQAAQAPTGTAHRSSAVTDHLLRPDLELIQDERRTGHGEGTVTSLPGAGLELVAATPGAGLDLVAAVHGPESGPGPGTGSDLPGEPDDPRSDGPGSDGAGPERGVSPDPLVTLLSRSRLPTRPGVRAEAVLRQVAVPQLPEPAPARRWTHPGALPARRGGEPRAVTELTRLRTDPGADRTDPGRTGTGRTTRDRHSLGRTYPEPVSRAAAVNRRLLADAPSPTSLQIQAMVVTAALRYGVDPALALALAYRESAFDQRRVSAANAIGVMQVVPSSGAWASTVVGRRLDLMDAEDNIIAGVAILSCLLACVPEPIAIAGYYQGLTSVEASGLFPDTRRYLAGVQTLRARFA